MTRRQIKTKKRQELISGMFPGAINFESIKKDQKIGNERVICVNIGRGTKIVLGNENGEHRDVYARLRVISNQPCLFVVT